MKKLLTIVLAAAVGVSALSALAGCKKDKEPETSAAENMVCAFDSDGEIRMVNFFSLSGATLALNTDKNYLTEGNGSLKIGIEGGYLEPMPNFFQGVANTNILTIYPKDSAFVKFAGKGDFRNVKAVEMDVYAVDRNVDLQLLIKANAGNVYTNHSPAEKGKWTHLVFGIDPYEASLRGFERISELCFLIPRLEDEIVENIYFDNLTVTEYAEGEKPDTNIPLPSVAPGMIADFEDDYLWHHLLTSPGDNSIGLPYFGIDKNLDPAFVTHGNASLKITRHPSVTQSSPYRRADYIEFPIDYIREIDFAEGIDPVKSQIAFDLWSDYDYTVDCVFQLTTATGYVNSITYVKPREWTKVTLDMNSRTQVGNAMDWHNVTSVRFMLHEYFGATDCVFYVDNIRIEEKE